MRVVAVVLVLVVCAVGIASLFWKQDLKYSLPTLVPVEYNFVSVGQSLTLPPSFEKGSAYFLHFYNPDCPCSRFNARHIKSLLREYSDSTKFVIVVSASDVIAKARKELGERLTIVVDNEGSISKACGVYSTPQAAIIDYNGKLFYRGNYNRTRYCTARASNFAELSLVALLNHQTPPAFGLLATQSYGCELGSKENADLEFF